DLDGSTVCRLEKCEEVVRETLAFLISVNVNDTSWNSLQEEPTSFVRDCCQLLPHVFLWKRIDGGVPYEPSFIIENNTRHGTGVVRSLRLRRNRQRQQKSDSDHSDSNRVQHKTTFLSQFRLLSVH